MWKIVNWRKSARDYAEARREPDVRYPGIPEKAFQMEQRRKRKRNAEQVNNFISNSTLHGLHFCFDKKHLIRRIIWSLILIAAFVYVGEKIYQSFSQYFHYPMSTTTTLVYDEPNINLPAISICNNNDFRRSIINGTDLEAILRTAGETNITLNGSEYRKSVTEANHKLEDMLIEGSFMGGKDAQRISPEDFVEYWDNTGTTRCYTYNSGKNKQINSVNRTGLNAAVYMEIDVQQYDYYDTRQAGLKLILHGQDETPIKTVGTLLSPGTVTNIEISKRKRVNLRKPFKTNCGSLKLKHFKSYSPHLCWLDKLTSHVHEKCGCIDAFMPNYGNPPAYQICGWTQLMNCTWDVWSNFDKKQDYFCPIPCEIEEFILKTSTAIFPSNVFADRIAEQKKLNGFPMENRMIVRENYLAFNVFFGELSYELVEQVPSYDFKVLLGDIGGQLGLFLGSSLLTYVEFFDCLLMVIYTKYFEVLLPR